MGPPCARRVKSGRAVLRPFAAPSVPCDDNAGLPMALLNLIDGELAYGALPLLDRASFAMEAGERIGLIGRNGTGKSSLLAVIAGKGTLDDGELRRSAGLRIALVEQEPGIASPDSLKKHKVGEFLHRFNLAPDAIDESMSGGERKRAALALAFAAE